MSAEPQGRNRASAAQTVGETMVPRYARADMTRIWAPENRFQIWFEIEALAAEAMAAYGAIPETAARTIRLEFMSARSRK